MPLPTAPPLPVWLAALGAALTAYALGFLAPGYSPASLLVRSYADRSASATGWWHRLSTALKADPSPFPFWLRQHAMSHAYPALLAHLAVQRDCT